MNIAVIGTGYVGLVAGTCFAETGNQVTCVDIDAKKIDMLNNGESPIFEPGLTGLIKKNVQAKRLNFTTNFDETIQDNQIIFSAVGTPSSEDGSADLTAVLKVAEDISRVLNEPKIIVNKSTVPVGTAQKIQDIIAKKARHKVSVVSNPEFLKEGDAINDFLKPDRVVIGTDDEETWLTMRKLYAPFVRQGNPIIRMSNLSAEITKYAANSMLATKISFINEIALLCDKVGADISSVRRGITTDSRIGTRFLYPGPGYGGSCFPKDVKAILRTAKDAGMEMKVIEATEEANARQKKVLGEKILQHFGKDLKGKTIAIWGLAFKPNTDDMREAPAITLVKQLLDANANIQAFDPIANDMATKIFTELKFDMSRIKIAPTAEVAVEGSDALVLVTEWNDFTNPDFAFIKSQLKEPTLFDGRNFWNPELLKEQGFNYYGMGRRV